MGARPLFYGVSLPEIASIAMIERLIDKPARFLNFHGDRIGPARSS
jgi:hypothetical protein